MNGTFKDGIEVWLRDLGDDSDQCWVPCAKGDPGAVMFVSVAEQSTALVINPITTAFVRFQEIYLQAGGGRQPKTVTAKGWDPARKVFERLIKKQKHDAEAIITGTAAYVATRPETRFVKAPEAFLNAEWFTKDWGRISEPTAPRGSQRGAPSLFDVEQSLTVR